MSFICDYLRKKYYQWKIRSLAEHGSCIDSTADYKDFLKAFYEFVRQFIKNDDYGKIMLSHSQELVLQTYCEDIDKKLGCGKKMC